MAMNIKLRKTIFKMGDEAFGLTKRGKKARKNIESLGLRMLIKKPLLTICHNPVFLECESNFNKPVSRHIAHAKYSKNAAPANLITWNARALICKIADNPSVLADKCGIIPAVQPKAAAILALQPRKRPFEIV